MTKDAHYESSSQLSSEYPTRGRNGERPKHLKFFLLVFLSIKQVVNVEPSGVQCFEESKSFER